MIFFDNFFCSLFYYIDRFLFWLWSNFGKVNANVTVYANKNKDTLQPLFRENNCRFVAKDFVKTCDELVIGQGYLVAAGGYDEYRWMGALDSVELLDPTSNKGWILGM